jgi:hypothetical protein
MSATGISAINTSQPHPPNAVGPSLAYPLRSALQSGDLAGAQQAYNILSALNNGNGPFQSPALKSAFAAVGTALQAGDLAGAQQAFSTLQQDVQERNTSHRGGGTVNPDVILQISPSASAAAAATSAASPASTSTGSAASTSTTPTAATATPEIVLNLNAGAAQQLGISVSNTSSGEQVTLNVGNGAKSPEQIQLNLAQNQALEINLIA